METNEKPFDYIAEANLTASDKFYGDRVSFEVLRHMMTEAINASRRLDLVKKSLFYGKGEPQLSARMGDAKCLPLSVGFHFETGRDIVHGIIGIATEAGELLEALYSSAYEGKSFDLVNVKEECGDLFWYIALLAKACDFTFEGCQRQNIAKLRMRFGEKFSEYDAQNRNLKAERSVLEADFSGASIASAAVATQMPPKLNETIDASVWASEFRKVCERLTEAERTDEGFLLGWFANAIMAGYDAAKGEGAKEVFAGHSNFANMVSTHIENWRDALKSLGNAEGFSEYINHELQALNAIEKACEVLKGE